MEKKSYLNRCKILYVEDDDIQREEMKIFLKRKVGKLVVAKDGIDGFEKFQKEKPDMVITDLRMPNKDGLELTKDIRSIDKKCPIIITTAFSDKENILSAVNLNIDQYILKPITPKKLLNTMEETIKIKLENMNIFIANDSMVFDRKERVSYEMELQLKFSQFIKNNTGKGPKLIKIFIKGDEIEVEALETLTFYEKQTIEFSKNKSLVSFLREAFYEDRKELLKEMIYKIVKENYNLTKIEIDLEEDKDRLIFKRKL